MKQKVFLLADDDSDDTEMFCEAVASIDSSIICHCTVNGHEALKKLNDITEKPHLIFLDMNMPLMNGWKCLKLLKEDERYKDIPVIMISTSSHQREMDIAADLGAICYIIKPNDFNEMIKVFQTIVANIGIGLAVALQNMQAGGSRFVYARPDSNKPT